MNISNKVSFSGLSTTLVLKDLNFDVHVCNLIFDKDAYIFSTFIDLS